ncbi:TVP38/TMEM64 family protein [Enterobacteriaceae bacterium G50]|nr:TVP38/TMEM64 family protein [Enterobacteriaceae bacterium G50]
MQAESKLILACLFFAVVCYLLHAYGLFSLLTDFSRLQAVVQQSGTRGYALYVALFILATLFLLPGSLLVIVGGLVFGTVTGTLLSLIAATLASALSFLFARWIGRDILLKYLGHTAVFQSIEKGIRRNGSDYLILTRLIPLFPYNIQNYAYGLTAIPFWRYTLISAVTTLPGIFIYTLMANELATQGLTDLFVAKLCLSGGVLFLLVQVAKRYARYRKIDLRQDPHHE